ncbi:MAG: hypothetical protein JST64_08110, partial [Actinobacteria bacterium]|nr:hypothetical protein [Actinomycetota bacterium]
VEHVDVDALIASLVDRRVEASIDTDLRAGTRPLNERALTRIVTNLLDNARRYRRSRSGVTATFEGGALVIRVDDDGPGIAVEDRARIFEPFTRLDEARVAEEGTGLGLAIVQELASASGGSVEVDTSELGGASFTVRLPTGQSPGADRVG